MGSNNSDHKLWGGRFTGVTNDVLKELNTSLPIDKRLWSEDLDGSKAYAKALHRAGIFTLEECDTVLKSLELLRYDWLENLVEFQDSDEDVHTVNERLLTKLTGDLGQKIHTGRSRNDQVITDMKLWMKKAIRETVVTLADVVDGMATVAENNLHVVMAGYTHLQRAQPVLFAHWLLSHSFALKEDYTRFRDLLGRVDVLPLGSGALAGNPLNVDRQFLAECLGFAKTTDNSMQAVGDRDFIVEFNFCAAQTGLHLSRLAEDLIIYSSKEFNFVRIADEFSTGSSLMPQKRNADSLELVRGISGEIFGTLAGFMMSLKGLPSTYNKDLQFDKKATFTAFDDLKKALLLIDGVIRTAKINQEACERALSPDMLATDWAYYLVKKGVPFRSAHQLIGNAVALAERKGAEITALTLDELKKNISPKFEADISKVSDYRASVEQYRVKGGTSTNSVKDQIKHLREFVNCVRTRSEGPLSEFNLK